VICQKGEHFRLRGFGVRFLDKNAWAMFRMNAPLFRQMEIERVVDLDPLVEVEGFQPDGKQL
jgi:hypothetical protein